MILEKSNAFCELMKIRAKGMPEDGELNVTGSDPFYATPFKIGETLTAALAARAETANDIWELRTGRRQTISLDVAACAATGMGGSDMTQKKGADGGYHPIPKTKELEHMVELTQPWECADGRWYLPHFNLPHLEKKVLNVLSCEGSAEAVASAVKKWNAEDLDRAITEAGATGGIVYTPEEWLAHLHGRHLAGLPVVMIEKVGESGPIPFSDNPTQPLSGIRVLELCRILAGPTCGISLAEHGADVLMVTAAHLPQVPPFVRDVSHGKRSCFLDYTDKTQARKLMALAEEADVFVEGYRPGSIARHGFGVKDIVKQNPGIVYVSVDCYGPGGVYSDRAGWDQCAQAVTGMAYTQGRAERAGRPKLTPVYCCDFLTGFLGAFGAMLALERRAKEGGSYHVRVSLCQSAMLLQREGIVDDFSNAPGKLTEKEFEEYALYDDNTYLGDLKSLGPVIRMSETNPCWGGTTPELGSSKPKWW